MNYETLIVVLAAIVAGLFVIGGPGEARVAVPEKLRGEV